MKQITLNATIHTLMHKIICATMLTILIGMVLPAMAAPLPSEPKPKSVLSGGTLGSPKQPVQIGTRPHFDPSNIGALPDLVIVRVKPKLHTQAIHACKTGNRTLGGMLLFEVTVKNMGKGIADFRKLYAFNVFATSQNNASPEMKGIIQYYSGKRSIYDKNLPPLHAFPGKTFKVYTSAFVNPRRFPVSRYSELAGKTYRFKISLGQGKASDLKESNYRNNIKYITYKFPNNFCKTSINGSVSQTAPTLKPHLVIQSIRTQLKRPYECRTDGPQFATGDLILKNTGGDFIPKAGGLVFNISGRVLAGRNRLLLNSVGYLRSRIPAGATRHIRFAMTGTAGILHMPTPSMSVLAGRTVPIHISLADGISGNRNSRIRFPADFCTSKAIGINNAPIGNNQKIKPSITGFQFAGGKRCLSQGGVFTIKGNAFGNSARGRTVELGGNRLGANLLIKSWSNRSIRVQLPSTARLQYRKNYWVAIRSTTRSERSNLKRGVVLCPPTVRAGGSASNPATGHQRGGSTINVSGGLPDLEVSRLNISRPRPSCFSLGTNRGWPKYYTLPKVNVSLTLHNKGRVPYSTFDAAHNKRLPIGIIGDRYVGPKNRQHISLCMVPVANLKFSNLNIPAGGSKTIQTQMQMMSCPFRRGKVVNQNQRLPDPLVRTLLGVTRPVKIGIGKAVFIRNKIPKESDYDNNYKQTMFQFPSRTCGGR